MSQEHGWEKLLKKIEDFLAKNRDESYIFRGQDRYTPQIRSALHRKIYGKKTPKKISDDLASLSLVNPLESAENELFDQMERRFFPGQDKQEVLAQLQHLGEPTNFIDFTDDHLVALFFACFSTEQGKEKKEENTSVIYFYNSSSAKSDSRTDQTSGTREGIFRSASRNNRIIAQRSCFIYQGNGTLGTDIPKISIEDDIENKEFFCLEIKKEWRQDILDYLEKKNMNYLYLFNDLEGHVRYRSSYESLTVLKEQFFQARDKNEDAKAISSLEKIVELNQEEAVKCTVLFLQNFIENASSEIAHFNKIIPEEKKRSAMFYFLRSTLYWGKREFEEALKDYNKVIELNPDYYWAYFYRGVLYAEKREYDKALKDYNKAIELKPDFYEAYFNRGYLYSEKKEYDKALNDFTQAIELKPDYYEAYDNRGVLYAQQKKYDKALKDFNQAIKLKPNSHQAYFNRGYLYNQKEEYEEALKDYNKAIELKPDFYQVYNNRGNLYKEKGEFDKALKDYNKAMELKSDFYQVYNSRGNFYKEKEEYEEALKDYNKAIELKPDDYEAYNNRAFIYIKQGKFKEALEDYNRAIELHHDSYLTYYYRALIYEHQGKLKEALTDCNKALEIKPDFAEALQLRAYLLKRIKEEGEDKN